MGPRLFHTQSLLFFFSRLAVHLTMSKILKQPLKLALVQLSTSADKTANLTRARSKVLEATSKGANLVVLPEYGKIAVAICYDVRFPELAMIAARKGAFLCVYPGAFNLTTGALHWELQARARAMDNQVYTAMCSPARDMQADSNAGILAQLEEKEDIVYADLTNEKIEETRKGIPIYGQRRFDVYPDVSAGKIKFEE